MSIYCRILSINSIMSEYIPTSTRFISVCRNDSERMECSSKILQCKCTNDTILFQKNRRYQNKYQFIACFVPTLKFPPFFSMECLFWSLNVVSMLPFNISPHEPCFLFCLCIFKFEATYRYPNFIQTMRKHTPIKTTMTTVWVLLLLPFIIS